MIKAALLILVISLIAKGGNTPCDLNEDLILTAEKFYQAQVRDWDGVWNLTSCTNTQCSCSLTEAEDECLGVCNNIECLYSMGNCVTCDLSCSKCFDSNSESCYSCNTGFLQYFSSCLDVCPKGYESINGICQLESDTTTTTNPDIIYVTNSNSGADEGTADNPYKSLAVAVISATKNYTMIYLLSGTHFLEKSTGYHASKTPVKELTIKTLRCSESTHAECATEAAIIKLNDLDYEFKFEKIKFVLFDLLIDAKQSLVKDCSTEYCYYCPSVTTVDSIDYSDKGTQLTNYAEKNLCSIYNQNVFILVKFGTLQIESVKFTDFRAEFKHLIESIDTSISLNSVEFNNIKASNFVVKVVCSSLHCSDFLYQTGSLKLLNNGFLNFETIDSYGFLDANNLKTVTISDVIIEYNLVVSTSSALIEITDCLQTVFEDLTFQYNHFTLGSLKWTGTKELPNDTLLHELTHISIKNTAYMNTVVAKGLVLDYSSQTDQFNIVIQNIDVKECYAENSAISIVNSSMFRTINSDGGYKDIPDAVFIDRKHIEMSQICLIHTYFASLALNIELTANIDINNSSIQFSGKSYTDTLNSVMQTYFIHNDNSYIDRDLPIGDFKVNTGAFVISDCTNLNASAFKISNNSFGNIEAFLLITNLSGVVTLADFEFSDNEGNASQALALQADIIGEFESSNISLLRNTNTSKIKGQIFKLVSTNILINNLKVANNKCIEASISLEFSKLTADKVSFEANTVQDKGTFELIGLTEIYAKLNMVTISRNVGILGSGIFIRSATYDSPFLLEAVGITISENIVQDEGKLFVITDEVILASGSYISNSKFSNNYFDLGGVFGIFLRAGSLQIIDSECLSNSGKNGVCISASFSSENIETTSLIITRCTFAFNEGVTIAYFRGNIYNLSLKTSKIKFNNNSGLPLYMLATTWEDSDSEYSQNSSMTGGVLLMNYSILRCARAKFSNNSSLLTGGAAIISQTSVGNFTDCLFYQNTASSKGGAVFVDSFATAHFLNTIFLQNAAKNTGGALGFETSSQNTIRNCTFIENTSHQAALLLYDSSASIDSSLFNSNIANTSSAIGLITSKLTIKDSKVINHTSAVGGSLFIIVSEFNAERCVFSNSTSIGTGGLLISVVGIVQLIDSTIENCQGEEGAVIFAITKSVIEITNSLVKSISGNDKTGSLSFSDSTLKVANSIFEDFSTSVVVASSSPIELVNSTFTNLQSNSGSVINCQSCTIILIDNIEARNCKSNTGGVFYISNLQDLNVNQLSIFNSKFIDNFANDIGGVLWLDNADLEINNSSLSGNSADLNAGSIYLSCSKSSNCQFNISNSEFTNNSSPFEGGAVQWVDVQPLIYNVTFINNTAKYGGDLASYPVALKIYDYDNLLLKNSDLPVIASGQSADVILYVALVDHYGNIVTSRSGANCNLIGTLNVTVRGMTTAISQDGLFAFQNFTIVSEPGHDAKFSFFTSSIDPLKQQYSLNKSNVTGWLSIQVMVRECIPGESLLANECFVCERGTYNLQPNAVCLDCPVEAYCYGGASIYPKEGYWRKDNQTDNFYACPNKGACLGGKETLSASGDCEVGYEGVMCGACSAGYAPYNITYCYKCISQIANVLVMLAGLVGLIGLVVIISKSAIKSAYKPKSIFSIYFKLMLNYLQLIALSSSLPLNWPSMVNDFSNVPKQADNQGQVFSIDCITNESPFIRASQILAIAPAVAGVLCMCVWAVISCIMKVNYLSSKIISSMCALLFLLHPIVTKHMFSFFNCQEIDGSFYMQSRLSIECWKGEHKETALYFAIPAIVTWSLGVPAICFMIMRHSKSSLQTLEVRIRYGFLYNGYTKEAYFWEAVILLRKISLIAVTTFFDSKKVLIQALLLIMILLICFSMQIIVKPYTNAQLNNLEIKMLFVAAITAYIGLFFYSKSLSLNFNIFLFTILICANSYYLLSWILCVSRSSLLILLTKKHRLRFLLKYSAIRRFFTENELSSLEDEVNNLVITNPQEPPTPIERSRLYSIRRASSIYSTSIISTDIYNVTTSPITEVSEIEVKSFTDEGFGTSRSFQPLELLSESSVESSQSEIEIYVDVSIE